MNANTLKIIRCFSCNKKIAKGYLHHGVIRIPCPTCGAVNTIKVKKT